MKHNKLLQYMWSYPLKTYIVKPMFKSQALLVSFNEIYVWCNYIQTSYLFIFGL